MDGTEEQSKGESGVVAQKIVYASVYPAAARYLPDSRIHVDVPSIYELRPRRIRRAVAPFPLPLNRIAELPGETCSNEEERDHGGHQLTLEVRNAR